MARLRFRTARCQDEKTGGDWGFLLSAKLSARGGNPPFLLSFLLHIVSPHLRHFCRHFFLIVGLFDGVGARRKGGKVECLLEVRCGEGHLA